MFFAAAAAAETYAHAAWESHPQRSRSNVLRSMTSYRADAAADTTMKAIKLLRNVSSLDDAVVG